MKRFSILRFREDEVGVMISEIPEKKIKKKEIEIINILLKFFVIAKNVPLGLKDITVVGVAVEGDGKLIEADF